MTSLKDVFKQSEDLLKEQLTGKFLPRDYQLVQNVINEHIIKLLSESNDFRLGLNVSDAALLNSVLKMALSFQKLTLSESLDFAKLSTKTEYEVLDEGQETDVLHDTITLLPTVISAFFGPWWAVAVGSATVAYKYARPSKGRSPKVVKRQIDISKEIPEDLLEAICDTISDICNEIDQVITKIKRDRTELESKYRLSLEEKTLEKMYPQILESLQYLFKDDIKSDEKNQIIENLVLQMNAYGYQVVTYSQENKNYFANQVKVGIETPEMYLPAIIKVDENGTATIAKEGILFIPKL